MKKSNAQFCFEYKQSIKSKIIKFYGSCCCKCGYDKDIRALCLDHKKGDGYLDRKRLGSKVSRYYINNIEESKDMLQILCCNCNKIKSVENNEFNRSRRVNIVV